MILGASSPTQSLPLALPFDEVAQDLAQAQNSIRIKKLLVYICTQTWESDPNRLHQVDLISLLHELRTIAPTAEQLQSRLDIAVHSLSKAAEYTLVANVIVAQVGRLYTDLSRRGGSADMGLYGEIAQQLEQDEDRDRIKKLLHLACKNVWVADPAQLAQLHLFDLVCDLHRLTPGLTILQAVLDSLVNNLSKRAEYSLTAQRICQVFQPLYAEVHTTVQMAASQVEPVEVTQFLPGQVLPAAQSGRSASPAQPAHPIATPVQPVQPKSSQPEPSQAELLADLLADLFDLRLEIIRSTNPYCAKIVLFSLLHHPFRQQAEHDSMLKGQTIDDLLRLMLQTYHWSALESQILSVAKRLESPDEMVQTARCILNSVKPFYGKLEQVTGSHAPINPLFAGLEPDDDATSFMGDRRNGGDRRGRSGLHSDISHSDITVAMPG
jgi:hypothetical protein